MRVRAAALALIAAWPAAAAAQAPAQRPAAPPEAVSDVPCFEPSERSLGEYHVISTELRRLLLQGINRLETYGDLPTDDVALKTTTVDKDVEVFIFVRRPHGGRTPLCYREAAAIPLKRYLDLVGAAVGGAP